MIKVEIVKCLKDNFSYIVHNNSDALVIDPSDSDPLIKSLEKLNLKLKYILNTHHHFDHVDGNLKLKDKYNSKIIGFEKDKDRIPGIDITLNDNQEFKIGNLKFTVIFVPGHTKGHIAFYFEKKKILFSGDTLFSLGCGRVFEGTLEQMFKSLKKIKNIPKDTKVYCGHEYTANNAKFCVGFDRKNNYLKERIKIVKKNQEENIPTIPTLLSDELNSNIFLRCDNINIKHNLKMDNSSELEVFTKLRALKDQF